MITTAQAKDKLYIKYMVSLRCKSLVMEELKKLNIQYAMVDLGVVEIPEGITSIQREQLRENLIHSGLELLDNKRHILIERIQNVVVEMIHFSDKLPKTNTSVYISEKLGYDYTYLSNLFAEVKGITLQNYIIAHRIEKVKELLLYDELNLSEISLQMQYSSVGHLSNQFKKITGLTPTFYKKMKEKRKSNLENL